jgi:hypothetical protein
LKLSRLIVNGRDLLSMVASTVREIEKNDSLLVGARSEKTWFAGPPVLPNLQLRMLLKTRKLQAYNSTGLARILEIYVVC